jgi:hypothetical protein
MKIPTPDQQHINVYNDDSGTSGNFNFFKTIWETKPQISEKFQSQESIYICEMEDETEFLKKNHITMELFTHIYAPHGIKYSTERYTGMRCFTSGFLLIKKNTWPGIPNSYPRSISNIR